MNRQAVRDPVILPTVIVVWAMVLLFVLYPLSRLLFLTFWSLSGITLPWFTGPVSGG